MSPSIPSPASPEDLLQRLEDLGIESHTIHHPPVFTVEESKAIRVRRPGIHCKNLFLRNKRGSQWLVVCGEDRVLDLKTLGRKFGTGRLSFASPERLMKDLGVIPGAVSPLAIVNDRDGQVQVILDRALLEHEMLNFHPLDNAMTTTIKASDLVRFLEAEGHVPTLIDMAESTVDS